MKKNEHQAKPGRDSNMELLRIVAMLFVLVLHANFISISEPTIQEVTSSPLNSFFRFFVEAFAIVCVNGFVLLSGWYGIKPKINRFLEFVFQIVFFSTIPYFIFNQYHRSLGEWLTIVLAFQYWFVKAYIILYLLSPILNRFIEKATKNEFKTILISFYCLQTIYGWHLGNASWFEQGYSPLSFIGLYLLARYIRIYCKFSIHSLWYAACYISGSFIIALAAFISVKNSNDSLIMTIYAYDSPLVIVTSLAFFLFFTQIKIKCNKVINYIAASAFSAYLFHYHECILHTFYTNIIKNWFLTCNPLIFILYVTVWILIIFSLSIILDKIRLFIWKSITHLFLSSKNDPNDIQSK